MRLTFSRLQQLSNIPFGREILFSLGIIVSLFILNFIAKFFLTSICKKLFKKAELFDIIYGSVRKLLRTFSILIGVWSISFIIETKMEVQLKYILIANRFFIALLWLSVGFFLIKLARTLRNYVIERSKRKDGGYDDFSTVHTLYKVAEIIIFLIIAITIFSYFNIPLTGFLAVGGISSAALAFANQNLIANIFSGVAIYFDRPFSIGDWIYTNDGKIEGTVEKIGLRLTKIRAFNKRPVYVPNNIFNSIPTINASRMTHRRIYQFIGIRYDDFSKVRKIKKELKEMLANHPDIDKRMITLVNLVNGSTNMGNNVEGCFGSSSINFQIYTFTKTTNWAKFQDIQDDVMLKIGEIILNNKAQFAFPSRSIYMGAKEEMNIPI